MTALLSVGEFAAMTHLSVKTLHHYHDAGLLEPERIDPHTGYRYYSPAQIPTAQVIRRFRDLDMPVRDVARLLAADVGERTSLISEHLTRLERRLASTAAAVGALHRLLAPDPPRLEVTHRVDPARRVTAISDVVTVADTLTWYADAMEEIGAAVTGTGARLTGPPAGQYDNELFTHGTGRMTVFVPTDREVRSGRVRPLDLPARELALVMHHGPHDDIDVTYGALGAHLTAHALVLDGPVHETYLVGPRDTPDATAWRTEIGWPVFTTTSPKGIS
ncbi:MULTISPECIES: MerR family transcriptional regulator [Catenuloplanes]|uniref:DNA-binding transcriptional MerR regulator/effector-binding domain-containing protein n=1 Tax=Catenuloplanes niger TaxID=587534 RepID=A0AAE3ZLE1_9ACTN|nr:MerR family transcriptional regulator [Catenuloplanes niger]MDR7321062.1 DNA-binding transcriptional MerR regulator/effector-binding domain-containing protein [Catenuloplanes niger]